MLVFKYMTFKYLEWYDLHSELHKIGTHTHRHCGLFVGL